MKTKIAFLFIILFSAVVAATLPVRLVDESIAYEVKKSLSNFQSTGEFGPPKETSKGEMLEEYPVSAKRIATLSQGISDKQVCVSLGKFNNNEDWTVVEPGKEYVSKTQEAYKAKVLCSKGTEIRQKIEEHKDPVITLEALKDCENFEEELMAPSSAYCVAVLSEKVPSAYAGAAPYGLEGIILPIAIIALATLIFAFVLRLTIMVFRTGIIGLVVPFVVFLVCIPVIGIFSAFAVTYFDFGILAGLGEMQGIARNVFNAAIIILAGILVAKWVISKETSFYYKSLVALFGAALLFLAFVLYTISALTLVTSI